MSGEKPSESGKAEAEDAALGTSGSPLQNAASGGSGVASPPAKPQIRHLDVEVRDAYRETFGQDAGNVTAGRNGLGGYRVSVLDPGGTEILGIGQSRDAAYDNLIDRIKSAAPQKNS